MNKDNNTNTALPLEAAIDFVKANSKSKFVGSIDLDIHLNLKDKKEVVRGGVNFPNAVGDKKRVIVFAEDKDAKVALEAGAVKAGTEELVEEITKGFMDFDIVIATQSTMPKIVKLAKILGPKGLMPNPKTGTVVTSDALAKTIQTFMAGRANFRTAQDQGVIRMKIGKVDMDTSKIVENVLALIKQIMLETKKTGTSSFKKIAMSPTMGPSVKLDVSDIISKL